MDPTKLRPAWSVVLMVLATATAIVTASAMASSATRAPSAGAATIRAEVDARYRLPPTRLAVTEASSTGVIESFLLLTGDLQDIRTVPADNGIYYAICQVGAICPSPAPSRARPAGDPLPRRIALELALRTFLETSADVVAVSLPTSRVVFFIAERAELAKDVDMRSLRKALRGDPVRPRALWVRRAIDRLTRTRLFLVIGLEPTSSGREALGAVPLWPTLSTGP